MLETSSSSVLEFSTCLVTRDRPIRSMKGAFQAACKAPNTTNVRFHDFRHTAITNFRRAGVDVLTIMQISGHKTMVCFTRYNSFREADLIAAA